MTFKYLKIIFCLIPAVVALISISQAAEGSSANAPVRFDGDKFSEMKAMEAFFLNAQVKQEDETLSIIAPNIDFSAVFSKWDNEQYCSAGDIKKYSLLSEGQYNTFLSGLAWKNDIRSWETLPFTVQGREKVYQVTQSHTCSARSCYAIIGVLLWAKNKTGWRLEAAVPCLTGMGEDGGCHAKVDVVQIGPTSHGIIFEDSYDDLEIAQLVVIDEQGRPRVAFNEDVGDGNIDISPVIADRIPPSLRYKYTSTISFKPGKNKAYWDMIVHYQGTRLKDMDGPYDKNQVIPYNTKKRLVFVNGRYIRRKK